MRLLGTEQHNYLPNFDIGRTVRLFKTDRPGAIRISLRKLHSRWGHASVMMMTRFLRHVGVPQRVLDLIPETVQMCQLCRAWTKPGPGHVSCTQNSDRFNEHVECSLFFIDQQHIIFHMLDRCTRWHTARPIPDTTEDTLKRTINEMWITIHGPPKELSVIRETVASRWKRRASIYTMTASHYTSEQRASTRVLSNGVALC